MEIEEEPTVGNVGEKRNSSIPKKYSSITYLDVDKLNWEMDNTFVLFRLSDMYLLRAEAHYELQEYDLARAYLKENTRKEQASQILWLITSRTINSALEFAKSE